MPSLISNDQILSKCQGGSDQFTNYTFKDLYELNKKPIWNQDENKNQNIGPVTKASYK